MRNGVHGALWRVDVLLVADGMSPSIAAALMRAVADRLVECGDRGPRRVDRADPTDESAADIVGMSIVVRGRDVRDAFAIAVNAVEDACRRVIGRLLQCWEVRVVPSPIPLH